MMKRNELSILIPVYNYPCVPLVTELAHQAKCVTGLQFEIIVADDGSTDSACIAQNMQINSIDNCKLVRQSTNVGRAKIRNILTQMAQYRWVLYIDSDMQIISPNYITAYLDVPYTAKIVYGGNSVKGAKKPLWNNLKYKYEQAAEATHTAQHRNMNPYRQFNTSNFMAQKSVIEAFPFDNRIDRYGYEDVLFGKQLHKAGIDILHIDNAVGFDTFESNTSFIQKTEEAMHTLYDFQNELQGYSHVLSAYTTLRRIGLTNVLRILFGIFQVSMRNNLLGTSPSLFIFKCYKLGCFLSLHARRKG